MLRPGGVEGQGPGGQSTPPRTGLPTSVRILALTLCKLHGGGGGSRCRTLPSEGHDLSSDSWISCSVAVWSPCQGRALGSGGVGSRPS